MYSKKLFLIASLLMGGVHVTHAMEGALYGAAVPIITGFCYAVGSKAPLDKKLGQWAMIGGSGALAGGISQLVLYTAMANPATAATVTAFTAATFGCGITGVWVMSKIIPKSVFPA